MPNPPRAAAATTSPNPSLTERPAAGPPAVDRRPTWSSVFGVAEFRGLWVAHALSMLGDQLARVALVVLVFDQTGSGMLAGLALAVTLLPEVLGGSLLAGLADRYPRREVMVCCDLLSVGLVALMAIPGLPLAVLLTIVFTVVLLASPFRAARGTLLTEVFPDDRYTLVSVVNNMTFQGSQVFGYVAGGVLVAAIGPRPALLINAATFAVAAGIVWLASPRRPAADSSGGAGGGTGGIRWTARIAAGARLVFGDRRLRRLVLLGWLAAFWVVPEGLAPRWAASLGRGAPTVGLLMAATAVGSVVGAVVIGRLMGPALRERLTLPLVVAAGAPMLLCAASPPLPVILLLLVLSGFGSSYQLVVNTTFMQTVPNSSRAQALGLAIAGLTAGQGLGLFAAGALADHLPPELVVAGAGAVGLVALLAITAIPVGAAPSSPSSAITR